VTLFSAWETFGALGRLCRWGGAKGLGTGARARHRGSPQRATAPAVARFVGTAGGSWIFQRRFSHSFPLPLALWPRGGAAASSRSRWVIARRRQRPDLRERPARRLRHLGARAL